MFEGTHHLLPRTYSEAMTEAPKLRTYGAHINWAGQRGLSSVLSRTREALL